jgi:hypothetical protein
LLNAERLAASGISYRPISPETASVLARLRSSAGDESIRAAAAAFVERFQTDLPTALVSWEGLLGMPFVDGSLYGGREPFFQMLAMASQMSGAKVETILTIRRQDDFINSWYAQLIKAGEVLSAKDYLRMINLRNLDWDQVVNDLMRYFQSTRIVPYELCRVEGEHSYLRAILAGTGIEVDGLKIEAGPVNVSYNAAALAITIFANRHAKFEKKERSAFRRLLIEHLNGGEPATVLTPEARKKIVDQYRDSNSERLKEAVAPSDVHRYYGVEVEPEIADLRLLG